jgi:RNase P subunit RPR2
MPQPQSLSQVSLFRHLLCPSCLTPMHVRMAEVAVGKERIQFVCDGCGTQAERNMKNSPVRTIGDI